MLTKKAGCSLAACLFGALLALSGQAAPVEIDVSNPLNGVTDIYSATFDPPLVPCSGSSPPYCSFFNGDPPPTRQLIITPNPTGVINGVPAGITGAPSAAYLDLTLGAGNTSLTLAGGAVKFDTLIITISGSTVVTATGAGFVFNAAPQTTSVDANGRAEFLVNLAPSTAVDFSTFSVVVTSCTGPLCSLIPILTLDMIRYRLVIDYDASFGSFTGDFQGQTANNSMVFATLNSGVPDIAVSDSIPPSGDLALPFGDVTELTTSTETVTVTNAGGGSLIIGNVAPLADPFALSNDTCSGQTLGLDDECTTDVSFTPGFVGPFNGTLSIPSNDADDPSADITLTGSGVSGAVPNIVITDSVLPSGDLRVLFGEVLQGGLEDQTVTISNNGTADLVIGQITGPEAPFSIQNDTCSNQTVQPSGNCTVGVRFEPTAGLDYVGSFDIPSNDADTPTARIDLTGSGSLAAPEIRITDPTAPDDDGQFTFQQVRQGGSFDRIITIVNDGTANLDIGTIAGVDTLAAPFSIVAADDDCSNQSLEPGTNCNVRLRFEPTALGEIDESFDVPSNDADEPSLMLSMSGEGIESPTAPPTPTPDGADSGFMAVDEPTLLLLAASGVMLRRRRRAA